MVSNPRSDRLSRPKFRFGSAGRFFQCLLRRWIDQDALDSTIRRFQMICRSPEPQLGKHGTESHRVGSQIVAAAADRSPSQIELLCSGAPGPLTLCRIAKSLIQRSSGSAEGFWWIAVALPPTLSLLGFGFAGGICDGRRDRKGRMGDHTTGTRNNSLLHGSMRALACSAH
jgi:hypothetical protein